MPLGPVMVDIAGLELTDDEIRRLKHPLVGGVILFSRNFQSVSQLLKLTAAIHALRIPALPIAVDHEGGRVQRFREGFTRIPPMREFGAIWDANPSRARHLAHLTGWVIASELRASGVDFSFTPVLDLEYGTSSVIGNRAFHAKPQAVSDLAHHLMIGLKQGGMAAVGKHFPGHGYVAADSHLEIPVDERSYADIAMSDLIPFRQMVDFGLAAIMPAHVIYPRVDSQPAGFSRRWLKDVLRGELNFDGVIFSDDLGMAGAATAGSFVERADAALDAGCDMVLVCNNPAAADEVLKGLKHKLSAAGYARLARMHGKPHSASWDKLHEDPEYVKAVRAVSSIGVKDGDLPFEAGKADVVGSL
ncbi:MAG: beta-N-acetylhexosaminidase [Sulfuricella sp.]|nr:beta-N-acetylhexosaminidase [Sulfuricella sp.]